MRTPCPRKVNPKDYHFWRPIIAIATSCLFIQISVAQAQTTPTPISQATISPLPPTEVVDGAGAPVPVAVADLPIQFFDDFSWRSFLALNWPAAPDARGQADTTKTLSDHDSIRVWETWKADYEAFQPGGSPPTEWISYDAVTPCINLPYQNGGKARLLAAFSKFNNFAEADFGADGNPLVAHNRTYTRYEVRVNRTEYDFIRDNKLYMRSTLDALTTPLRFTPNSIEVKAAWKQLTASEVAAATTRYYVIKAAVLDPLNNDVCDDRFMALVGFHIVQKTLLRPQWVWSSFEHVDNVPQFGDAHPTGTFSYNDPALPQQLIPSAEPPPLSSSNPPLPSPVPMQVIRQVDIRSQRADDTKATNLRYQTALAGSIWANYQLVLTQWPTQTTDPTQPFPENISGNPFPPDSTQGAVGNTVLETYHQTDSSCMDCHDMARSQLHTDFVFFINLRAQPPSRNVFEKISRKMAAFADKQKKNTPVVTIVCKNSPHQWAVMGDSTKDHVNGTKVGDPVNRLQISVASGDIVSFVVESGTHHVLFENAVTEQAHGVWELAADSAPSSDCRTENFLPSITTMQEALKQEPGHSLR